ncbi:MAG TPA: nucleotidyl transferase AbiEii/AbiGii toxin family protein [Humisphaera sp.]|nr:nucleotidyl transferase AbiEii/AbiGii toxin family protein [Humisphaera sp.]
MFGDGSLTLAEFAMKEPLPLARVHEAVLDFLRNRDDAVLFGAQAVNAYVDEPRMTQDVDILSTRAAEFAEELRSHLNQLFHIAVRVRVVAEGKGFRVFQMREPKNRHLADIRQAQSLPPTQVIAEIRVPTPEELIAQKVISCVHRRTQPKGDTDRRDVKMLLLAHPQLKAATGAVHDRLRAANADSEVLQAWGEFVSAPIDANEADDW